MNLQSSLLRWSSLQKGGKRHGECCLVGLENNQIKAFGSDHRKDKRYCTWPFLQPCIDNVLECCSLTNKAVDILLRDLYKSQQRRQNPHPCPLWMLFRTPSALVSEFAYSFGVANPTMADISRYFDTLFFITLDVC